MTHHYAPPGHAVKVAGLALGPSQLGRQCFGSMTFVPKAGTDYQLSASSLHGCVVELAQVWVRNGRTEVILGTDLGPTKKAVLCNELDNF